MNNQEIRVSIGNIMLLFMGLRAIDLQSDDLDIEHMQELIRGLGKMGQEITTPLFFEFDNLAKISPGLEGERK